MRAELRAGFNETDVDCVAGILSGRVAWLLSDNVAGIARAATVGGGGGHFDISCIRSFIQIA